MRELYLDIRDLLHHPPLPQLTNTDGEPLCQYTLRYEIDSPEWAAEALADLQGSSQAESEPRTACWRNAEGRVVGAKIDWTRQEDGTGALSTTVLGFIRIDGRRMTVEVNSARRAEVIKEEVSLDIKGLRTKIREIIKTDVAGAKKIDEADCVISGGRGMCTEDSFNTLEGLAKELDGVVGASRVVIDLGWRPKSVQVGQSGITVSPKLYFACGISGAIQHTVGMRGADTIVAINKDPNAPIFEFAQYGLVGDCNELIPLLVEEIKARKAEK